jgi:UDP:flavonoid glycosyltransferase YjiC (YdhE family)
VLQKVIDATAALRVRTLITLGQIAPDEVSPAQNTVLAPSAPHDAVMREASLVVTHGGHGTVMRALTHQRPMLIIPHGRDQDENAIRVTERGAGLKLPATSSVMQLEIAVQQLLQDPSFAEAARKLGSAIAAEAREDLVTQPLEKLAARGNKIAVGRSLEADISQANRFCH